jgi:hypothetical protein
MAWPLGWLTEAERLRTPLMAGMELTAGFATSPEEEAGFGEEGADSEDMGLVGRARCSCSVNDSVVGAGRGDPVDIRY